MTRKKLRDAQIETSIVQYEQRPALWGDVCDGCGKVFQMDMRNGVECGVMVGMFDLAMQDRGNGFRAHTCSFACADTIWYGGWKHIAAYRPLAALGARLVRVTYSIQESVLDEDAILQAWEAIEIPPPARVSTTRHGITITQGGMFPVQEEDV